MSYFLVNEALPKDMRAALARYGECISLPPFDKLPHPVNKHPDMLMTQIGETVFVHREYEAGQRILERLGVPYHLSEKAVGEKYPADVALNCFAAGGYLFGKLSAVSDEVKAYAKEQGLVLQSVSQGYTKCSCAVAGRAVVTADVGIFRAAKEAGLSVLLVPPRHIGIEMYDAGFLGGASVTLDEDTLGFFGDLGRHPAGEEIRAFFEEAGINVVCLSGDPLFDYGGAIKID